jgi:hypothetical protein
MTYGIGMVVFIRRNEGVVFLRIGRFYSDVLPSSSMSRRRSRMSCHRGSGPV